MDKKYIEYPNKIDRKEYEKKYKKEHYVRFSASIKPELKKRVDDYCRENGISKTEFINRSIDMLEKQ